MSENIIEIRNIYKQFTIQGKGQKVIENIDFDIKKGETIFLNGPSGAGKTTLLFIINGWLEPDSGDIYAEGNSLYLMPPAERIEFCRDFFAQAYQTPVWISYLNSLENLIEPLIIQGYTFFEARQTVLDYLKKFNLENEARKNPYDLSGGQQQKLNIIRAYIKKPKVLILDEPTSHLDQKNAEMILEFLEQIDTEEITVIIASHSLDFIKISNKFLSIENGKINFIKTLK